MPASFLVVDDHPLFREAIQLAIGLAYPEAKMAEATSIAGAKEAIAREGPFDLVLLDLSMPGTHGFDGLLELRTAHPKLPIVIVSALEDPRIVHEAMTYGAAGFIYKSARKPELVDAIRDIMGGSVSLPKGYEPPQAGAQSGRLKDLSRRLASSRRSNCASCSCCARASSTSRSPTSSTSARRR